VEAQSHSPSGGWLGFIELKPFTRLWDGLRLTDDDLWLVQVAILCNPKGFPVIPGTGGLRKLRFSPRNTTSGKRGGMRVCYVYLEEHQRVILALVYPKSQKEDLSAGEKRIIRAALEQIERELRSST
jgi:hypothetical protein